MFNNIYNKRKVLVTGHTGFKGSWMVVWLLQFGAEVTGYSLSPPTEPNHYDLFDFNIDIDSIIGDVEDGKKLKKIFKEKQPEIVFHLAAQPIVRFSYKKPAETFSTNVMGSVNVLEAVRETGSVRALINVTSDKCYENKEWVWGYREDDSLGGYDPYSASKGCVEIITNCWRKSFFNIEEYGKKHDTLLATVRAGNVIGGGDWAIDRLIPDMMRAASRKEALILRNPKATRPWQHVLEPLSGYFLLGQKLLEGKSKFAQAWNFGPSAEDNITVEEIAEQAKQIWPDLVYKVENPFEQPHEAGMLKLDCSKARTELNWKPVWNGSIALEKTVQWYRSFYESKEIKTLEDINHYIEDTKRKNNLWAE